jgi:selT/selW/selH-like putative selenoprotein
VPGGSGQFEVVVNGDLVFSKTAEGRYPEIKELAEAINRFLD